MSIDALRWAKKVKTGSSSSKSVLTWLADMCGADLCAYPSVSALAEVTELNKKTVQDSLRHLMEIGLIVDTGERKGRTKQIVVYRLIGVEESVAEPEYTQKRESLKVSKIGAVNKNSTENGYVSAQNRPKNGTLGCMENNQRHPNFPSKTPKNGSRNPKEPKDLNPTHNARVRESAPTSESSGTPLQTAEPEYLDGMSEPIGKFPMTGVWHPSLDFRRRAALWGMALPEPEFTPAELAAFRDYWAAEGKVFTQVQWEQKFARHVNHVRAQVKQVGRGVNHAAAPGGTASRAVQEIREARERWERENGFISNGNGLEAVGAHGGGVFEPLDPEERGRTFEALDCTDWCDDRTANPAGLPPVHGPLPGG
ncbi:DnaT-like ssDNA-binding domain-containing protein [Escherichia coli]|uniref:DnaT-like ssDNA-binding domain-containing protein n=1 Tax=Escherichia coli TaxID=562 RepID=UPI001F0F837E|nr:DnaT-like ssDNA-binding domain-containing protein [Escherichia coli]